MTSRLLLAKPPRKEEATMEAFSTAQSLALVQIFINASLACICYSRELLPYYSKCFQSRFMNDLKSWKATDCDYQSFVRLDVHLQPGLSQEFKFLTRGENEAANQILNLLEAGLFDSLNKGYLEAVQFFVTPDIEDPMAVYESYTFTFTYGKGSSRITAVELSATGKSFVVDAFKSFKRAIKSLLEGLQDLPRLPRKKSLGMSLTYNSSCPLEYQPTGFHDPSPSSSQENAADWGILWDQQRVAVGEFEVGSYHLSICTNHTETNHLANATTISQEEDIHFGAQLEAMQKTSSLPNNLVSTVSERNRGGTAQGHSSQPGQIAPKSSRGMPTRKLDAVLNSQELHRHEGTPTTGRMMTSSATRANSGVSSKRSSLSSGAVTFGRSKKAVPATNAASKNRRQRNVNPQKMAELVVHACAMENHNKSEYIFDVGELKENKIVRLRPEMEVRCECQSPCETDQMLFCNLCGTTQHKDCYGFREMRSKKLPEEHFCYTCLLLPKEKVLNAQMPAKVRMRLTLDYLYSRTSSSVHVDAHLFDAIHLNTENPLDLQSFEAILASLVEEGYVTKRGAQTLEIVKARKADAQINYLDHLASIWEHYEAAKDNETAKMRYNVIQAAIDEYAAGRSYLVDDPCPVYDEVTVEDAFGQSILRWGYYDDRDVGTVVPVAREFKRKASPETYSTPKRARGRKLSIGDFVNVDWFTPSTNRTTSGTEDGGSEIVEVSECE